VIHFFGILKGTVEGVVRHFGKKPFTDKKIGIEVNWKLRKVISSFFFYTKYLNLKVTSFVKNSSPLAEVHLKFSDQLIWSVFFILSQLTVVNS
jgi:hypothetical protein